MTETVLLNWMGEIYVIYLSYSIFYKNIAICSEFKLEDWNMQSIVYSAVLFF